VAFYVRGRKLLIKEIYVETFLSYLGQGVTRPALILGDDAQTYILKTQKVSDGQGLDTYDCMFLNELLSSQIADYLGVPAPEAAIAKLDGALIEHDPEITFVHRFYEGKHFASLEVKENEDNLMENYQEQLRMRKPLIKRSWKKFFENITNKNDIPKILAFDLLIANFDRYGNTGNLLVASTDNGRKVLSIDHGHAFFGPKWDQNKMNIIQAIEYSDEYVNKIINTILGNNEGIANGLGEVFRAIEEYVSLDDLNLHSFQEIVYHIEGISEELIDSWLNNIPEEWFVEKMIQKSYYTHLIMQHKYLIRHFIQCMANRSAFSNFRGGVLNWKEEQRAGTV